LTKLTIEQELTHSSHKGERVISRVKLILVLTLFLAGALGITFIAAPWKGVWVNMKDKRPHTYSQEVLQEVIDEAAKDLEHKGLLDKVAILAIGDQQIELGFYDKVDLQIVEIVKAVIDRRAPGTPLEVVENVTTITQSAR
jgi:hypothetical protein